MATLAYDGRRRDFFEAQLIAALQILQSGDVAPRQMVGSWAGAMGHTQFMPTSYLEHAQDFNGDGRRDIWSNDPTDALASTAAYLAQLRLDLRPALGRGGPPAAGLRLCPDRRTHAARGGVLARQGVTLADGGQVPDHGDASILLPAGADGVALMIFDNFRVIERYNPADAYVIGVGHLSDRIAGGPAFRAGWPRGDRALTGDERRELQQRLAAAGFSTGNIDGIIGPQHAGGRAPFPAIGRRGARWLRLAQVAGASALTGSPSAICPGARTSAHQPPWPAHRVVAAGAERRLHP
jgi:membrane-bound lytic murein transglycosylase B